MLSFALTRSAGLKPVSAGTSWNIMELEMFACDLIPVHCPCPLLDFDISGLVCYFINCLEVRAGS